MTIIHDNSTNINIIFHLSTHITDSSPYLHFSTNYIDSSIKMEEFQGSNITQCSQRCHQSHSLGIHQSRLLPHIREEYDFRITNRLLIQKITNPRRDRVIMDSLLNASRRNIQKKTISGLPNEKTILHRRKMIGHRKVKYQDSAVQVDCLGETESTNSNRNKAIIRLQLSKSKYFTEDFPQLNQTCDIGQSKLNKDDSNLRNNFVGRIIKNRGTNKRNQIIEQSFRAHPQTQNIANINNFQSQCDNQMFTIKRIVRRPNVNKWKQNKQNNERYDEF